AESEGPAGGAAGPLRRPGRSGGSGHRRRSSTTNWCGRRLRSPACMNAVSVERDLRFALRLADLADAVSMSMFTAAPMSYDTKIDGSPVTEADVAVESLLRDAVAKYRPEDGFLGEEGAGWWAGPRR